MLFSFLKFHVAPSNFLPPKNSVLSTLPLWGVNFYCGNISTFLLCVSSSLCLSWLPPWLRASTSHRSSLLACPLAGGCTWQRPLCTHAGVTILYEVLCKCWANTLLVFKSITQALTVVSWIILYFLQPNKTSFSEQGSCLCVFGKAVLSLYSNITQSWWNYAQYFFWYFLSYNLHSLNSN